MASDMKLITVDEIRRIAKEHNLPAVIVLCTDGDRVGYTSYGRDRKACNATRDLAEKILRLIEPDDVMWRLRNVLQLGEGKLG